MDRRQGVGLAKDLLQSCLPYAVLLEGLPAYLAITRLAFDHPAMTTAALSVLFWANRNPRMLGNKLKLFGST